MKTKTTKMSDKGLYGAIKAKPDGMAAGSGKASTKPKGMMPTKAGKKGMKNSYC